MKEVECPKCNSIFEMDAAGYASILTQVRTAEFEIELAKRLHEAKKGQAMEIQLAEAKLIKEKDIEFANKEKEIQRLKGDLEKKEMEIQIAVTDATTLKINLLIYKIESTTLIQKNHYLRKSSKRNIKLFSERGSNNTDEKDDEIELRMI